MVKNAKFIIEIIKDISFNWNKKFVVYCQNPISSYALPGVRNNA